MMTKYRRLHLTKSLRATWERWKPSAEHTGEHFSSMRGSRTDLPILSLNSIRRSQPVRRATLQMLILISKRSLLSTGFSGTFVFLSTQYIRLRRTKTDKKYQKSIKKMWKQFWVTRPTSINSRKLSKLKMLIILSKNYQTNSLKPSSIVSLIS